MIGPDVNVPSANLSHTCHIIQLMFVVWNALCLLIAAYLNFVIRFPNLFEASPSLAVPVNLISQGWWSLAKDYGLFDVEETSATWHTPKAMNVVCVDHGGQAPGNSVDLRMDSHSEM